MKQNCNRVYILLLIIVIFFSKKTFANIKFSMDYNGNSIDRMKYTLSYGNESNSNDILTFRVSLEKMFLSGNILNDLREYYLLGDKYLSDGNLFLSLAMKYKVFDSRDHGIYLTVEYSNPLDFNEFLYFFIYKDIYRNINITTEYNFKNNLSFILSYDKVFNSIGDSVSLALEKKINGNGYFTNSIGYRFYKTIKTTSKDKYLVNLFGRTYEIDIKNNKILFYRESSFYYRTRILFNEYNETNLYLIYNIREYQEKNISLKVIFEY